MARSHFAIERPRRISISIQGYDAQAQTTDQERKRSESRRRKKKREVQKEQASQASSKAALKRAADEIDGLAAAAAVPTQKHTFEGELAEAFHVPGPSGLSKRGTSC